MISAAYCQTMARYNAWQNKRLSESLQALPGAALTEDQGAFFGSIMATLSHLAWGDAMWLSRLGAGDPPQGGGIEDSVDMIPDRATWLEMRPKLDQQITDWAAAVSDEQLAGDLSWYSGALQKGMVTPIALCVAHLFNHQTHHRGQVHAMLTRAGVHAPVTDLAFMPGGM
ncbi:MAG: DinB family protein [Rhodobacteraceae bacterium]|nr:DinB family protein [Paracoccaceae bacterium]